MPAPKGNKFWLKRATHGRDKMFATSENLWESCLEYFEWVAENPLYEHKAFSYNGEVKIEPIPKMRAMSIAGICNFLGVSKETWRKYKKNQDFVGVITQAEQVMFDQKFAGASADLLNANIIARDLGLSDKSEVKSESTNKNITVDVSKLTTKELAALEKAINDFDADAS